MYLTQQLHRRARVSPAEPFTIYQGHVTTNAEMEERAARIAGGLRSLGVRHDDRVALIDVNTDLFFHAAAGVAWADGIIVPVNYRWSIKEMAFSLIEAGVETVIVGDLFLDLIEPLRAAAPGLRHVVHMGDLPTPDGMVPLSQLLAAEPAPDAERGGASLLGLFYTGGTTGEPRGVMLSHDGIMLNSIAAASVGHYPVRGAQLLAAPAFHLAGFGAWIAAMLQDQASVALSEFTPANVLRAINDDKITMVLLVPTMIQMLADHPDLTQYDRSSLELILYGASPISEAVLARARKAFPSARFVQAYGQTELSPSVTILRDADHDHPVHRRSGGRPISYAEVKIVDGEDHELPRGEVGEIVARGDLVMLGYWNKPEETAYALRNGWMHTGDGGYMDEDGYVYIVDRIKDMIITGGENVYSIEVENAIARHPAVMQCVVVGRPDETWGERVHAVVELAPGATLTLEELREFTKQEIAGYKCPRSLELVNAWPMSAAGKILKREIRAQHI
ncbi:MAG: long-chain-fatty-acid--CoA ligase [Actinomycetia bacterium]|nr:long-chain-fatty-acid--CoA ligase [Actinomycetes bacterium]